MEWDVAGREHCKCEFYLPIVESAMVDPLAFGVGFLVVEFDVGNAGMAGGLYFFCRHGTKRGTNDC